MEEEVYLISFWMLKRPGNHASDATPYFVVRGSYDTARQAAVDALHDDFDANSFVDWDDPQRGNFIAESTHKDGDGYYAGVVVQKIMMYEF